MMTAMCKPDDRAADRRCDFSALFEFMCLYLTYVFLAGCTLALSLPFFGRVTFDKICADFSDAMAVFCRAEGIARLKTHLVPKFKQKVTVTTGTNECLCSAHRSVVHFRY